MTTIHGQYMFCKADARFSMTSICAGDHCKAVLSRSGLTCTHNGPDSWHCHTGVECAGTPMLVSNFTIVQSLKTISQNQHLSVNGHKYNFQQTGMGNATIVNGTKPLGAIEPTFDINARSHGKRNSGCSRRSYSTSLLIIMLLLGLFLPQSCEALTGADVGAAVNDVFNLFSEGLSAFNIGAEAVAGKFNEIAAEGCGKLIAGGVDGLVGAEAEVFGQCEEALLGFEMSLIGSSLGLTLRTYAGIGGLLVKGLTLADVTAVLAVDAGVLAETFLVNSALCGVLVSVIVEGVLDKSATSFCAAVESAAAGIHNGAVISSIVSSAAAPSTAATTSTSPPSTSVSVPSTASSHAPPSPTPGSPIPDLSDDACAECEVSLYFIGVQGLAKYCHVAVPLGVGYDLAALLCDSSLNGRYAAFCSYLCANQCVTYDIQKWIDSAGAQYMPDATLALCNMQCPGFKGDGRCEAADPCPCAQGAATCEPCS